MKLFIIILVILIIFLIPVPIKFSIYYSTVDYYLKLYKLTIISKKRIRHREKHSDKSVTLMKRKSKFFLQLYKNIDFRSLISYLYNSKFKPLLKIKFSLDYSLNDAARTALFYGLLCQVPSLIYAIINVPFKIYKFDFKVNPVFEDKFLLKFEISSIIFLSFANIIYIIIILFKFNNKAKEVTP